MKRNFNHDNLSRLFCATIVSMIIPLAFCCDSKPVMEYKVITELDSVGCKACKVTSLPEARLAHAIGVLELYIEEYNAMKYNEFRDKRKYLPERNVSRKYFVIDLPSYSLQLLPLIKQNDEEVWIRGSIPTQPDRARMNTCNDGKLFYFDAKVSLANDSVYEFYHNNPELWYNKNTSWTLVWSDDFDSSHLNATEWIPLERGKNYNDEKQAYTPENVLVEDGLLKLVARKQAWRGVDHTASKDSVERQYTSGEVRTRRAWTYGKFVAKMKCPKTKGTISAFWMTTGTEVWPPEIDIAEVLGHDPSTVYFSNHYGTVETHQMDNGSFKGPDLSDDFHEFAVEWEPDVIRWLVDGKVYHETRRNIPNQPFYLRFSLPVGATWSGVPDVSSQFPSSLSFDWIKVYQRCDYLK